MIPRELPDAPKQKQRLNLGQRKPDGLQLAYLLIIRLTDGVEIILPPTFSGTMRFRSI